MEGAFDHKDHYLDSNIRTPNGDLIFSITSDHSTWKGYKTTWLRGNQGGQPLGIIHWETRAFEIYGRLVPWDNLKSSGGHRYRSFLAPHFVSWLTWGISSTRLWRWSTTQYQLEYKDHEWKVRLYFLVCISLDLILVNIYPGCSTRHYVLGGAVLPLPISHLS